MTWKLDSSPISGTFFGTLEPEDVLYEFDGPQFYVTRESGRPLLVYVADSDEDELVRRLLVVPTSHTIVRGLRDGSCSVCDALRQPWLHVVDQNFDGTIVGVWFMEEGLDSVPSDYKPVEGTLLSVELEYKRAEAEKISARIVDVSAAAQKAELRRSVSPGKAAERYIPNPLQRIKREIEIQGEKYASVRVELNWAAGHFVPGIGVPIAEGNWSSMNVKSGAVHANEEYDYRRTRASVRTSSHRHSYIPIDRKLNLKRFTS